MPYSSSISSTEAKPHDAFYEQALEYAQQNHFDLAFQMLFYAAETNHLESMYLVGKGAFNRPPIIEFLKRASDGGHVEARYELAKYYLIPPYKPSSVSLAIELLKANVEKNHLESMVSLGHVYVSGLDGKTNYKKALKYFELGSEHGSTNATFFLAKMYDRGLGCEQDNKKAINLAIKALELKDRSIIYENQSALIEDVFNSIIEKTLKNDFHKIWPLIKAISLLSNSEATIFAELLSKHLKNTKKLKRKKVLKYLLSEDIRDNPSAYLLSLDFENLDDLFEKAKDYLEHQDYKKAIHLLKIATKKGHLSAKLELAKHYINKPNGSMDSDEALKLLDENISVEHVESIKFKANLYLHGVGVQQDLSEAFRLFTLGDELGDPISSVCLAKMYDSGFGCEQSLDKALNLVAKTSSLKNKSFSDKQAFLMESFLDGLIEKRLTIEFDKIVPLIKAIGSLPNSEAKHIAKIFNKKLENLPEVKKNQVLNYLSQIHLQDYPSAYMLGFDFENIDDLYLRAKEYYTNRQMNNALTLFTIAAEKGHVESMFYLGVGNLNGLTESPNIKFLKRASDEGHLNAKLELARYYINKPDASFYYDDTFKLLDENISQQHTSSIRFKASLYLRGIGTPIDHKESFKLFKQGDLLGDIFSTLLLAQMYNLGAGCKQNLKESRRLAIKLLPHIDKVTATFAKKSILESLLNDVIKQTLETKIDEIWPLLRALSSLPKIDYDFIVEMVHAHLKSIPFSKRVQAIELFLSNKNIDDWQPDEIAMLNDAYKVTVQSNVTKEQLRAIPSSIKKIKIPAHLDLELIKILVEEKKLDLEIHHYDFSIASKYLGEPLCHLKMPCEEKGKKKKRQIKAEIPFVHFVQSGDKSLDTIKTEKIGIMDGIHLTYMTNSTFPKEDEPIIFLFAGRQEKALLPQTGAIRVVVVLTQDEYKALSQLNLNVDQYDVLIIDKIKKPFKEHEDQVSTINSRRFAALLCAQHYNLNHLLMLDDNIDSLLIYDEETPKSMDGIYEAFLRFQQEQKSPFVSVRTHNSKKTNTSPDKLGAKVQFWDLKWINNYFNKAPFNLGDRSIIKLMCFLPEDENQWGEDYFAQTVLHCLAQSIGQKGFAHLPNVEIVRDKKALNACVRQGVRAKPIQLSLKYSNYLEKISPQLRNVVESSTMIFNNIVKQRIEQYERQQEIRRRLNIEQYHAQLNGIKVTPLPQPVPQGQLFTQQLSSTLTNITKQLVTLPEDSFKLFPHQIEAIQSLINHIDKSPVSSHFLFKMATGSGKTLVQTLLALTALSIDTKSVVIVTPFRSLTIQTYDAIQKYISELPLLSSLINVSPSRVIKVLSGDKKALPQRLLVDKISAEKRFLLVTCLESWNNLVEQNRSIINQFSCVIKDESHLTEKRYLTDATIPQPLLSLYFSATPSPKCTYDGEYVYSIERGIKESRLTPLHVDASLHDDDFYNHDKKESRLMLLLKKHVHLSGLPLVESKGVVFCTARDEAASLYELFKETFPGKRVFLITSANEQNKKDILEFKRTPQAVAFVVDMMIEGFDDKRIDWAFISSKRHTTQKRIVQIAGRIIRMDRNNPHKIGLLIGPEKIKKHIQSIHPQKEAIKEYASISATLNHYAGHQQEAQLISLFASSPQRQSVKTGAEMDFSDSTDSMNTRDKKHSPLTDKKIENKDTENLYFKGKRSFDENHASGDGKRLRIEPAQRSSIDGWSVKKSQTAKETQNHAGFFSKKRNSPVGINEESEMKRTRVLSI